ncbi:hypothetical protein ACFV0R_23725 [Streptomyces sp. NPDC059578]
MRPAPAPRAPDRDRTPGRPRTPRASLRSTRPTGTTNHPIEEYQP